MLYNITFNNDKGEPENGSYSMFLDGFAESAVAEIYRRFHDEYDFKNGFAMQSTFMEMSDAISYVKMLDDGKFVFTMYMGDEVYTEFEFEIDLEEVL